MDLRIKCAVCIKEDRPAPHRYSFVNVVSWQEYQAREFFDTDGKLHYHCRRTGIFRCTFGHRFQRHNLPYVKCPACGYDVDRQRATEAHMEVCVPPKVK
jgi:hypothetical protein